MLIRENRELCKYVFTFCKMFLYLSELSEKEFFSPWKMISTANRKYKYVCVYVHEFMWC